MSSLVNYRDISLLSNIMLNDLDKEMEKQGTSPGRAAETTVRTAPYTVVY